MRAIPLTPSTIVIAAASVQGAGYRVQGDAASPLLPAMVAIGFAPTAFETLAGYRVQGAGHRAPTAFETLAAPEDALVSK